MPKTTAVSDTNGGLKVITKQTGISLGILILLLTPLLGSVWFMSTTTQQVNSLKAKVLVLETQLAEHEEKGINGLPHPQGLVACIEGIKCSISERDKVRWTETDDFYFMEKFANKNDLKLPDHGRITKDSGVDR